MKKQVVYTIDKTLSNDLEKFHGISTNLIILSMTINSALSDLKLPAAVTLREVEDSIEVIVERVSHL